MTEDAPDGPDVADLLARQAQLKAWIERLDDEADGVPQHVAARVRADYDERLRAVIDRLGAHRDSIEAEVARLREALRETRDARERTADELAEGRLRHRLGEWDDEEWASRRGDLERDAEESAEREAGTGAELARFEELRAQLEGEAGGPAAAAFAAPAPAEAYETDDGLESDDDLAFLEGLDRALALSAASSGDSDDARLTRPGTGVKCPECGYTNDSTAWFCGVCGVDLT